MIRCDKLALRGSIIVLTYQRRMKLTKLRYWPEQFMLQNLRKAQNTNNFEFIVSPLSIIIILYMSMSPLKYDDS